jgi:hypothetical protein
MKWEWAFRHTSAGKPFVTSDRPVYLERVSDARLVSFPLSSKVAAVVTNKGAISPNRCLAKDVEVMNRQTICRASDFIICSQPSFPGDEFLDTWRQNPPGGTVC